MGSAWNIVYVDFVMVAGGLDPTTFKSSLPTQTILQLLHRSRTCQWSTPSFPLLRKDDINPWKPGWDKAQMHTAKLLTIGELPADMQALQSAKVLNHRSVPVLPPGFQRHFHVPAPPHEHSCSQLCSTWCSNYLCCEAPTLWVGGLQHRGEKVVSVQKVSAFPVSPSREEVCTI